MTTLSSTRVILSLADSKRSVKNGNAMQTECGLQEEQPSRHLIERHGIHQLVVPWISIVVIACIFAMGNTTTTTTTTTTNGTIEHHNVVSALQQQSGTNEQLYFLYDRRLMTEFNDDDTTPATSTTTASSSSSSSTIPKYTSSTLNIDPSTSSSSIPFQQEQELDQSRQQQFQQSSHHKPVFQEEHKPLLPLDKSDYYGVIFTILGLMIAAGGGIGGGGILVPIYILIMGFSPKHAIPLSNVTVFGGAIANVLLNMSKRHPIADRPLVDWDLILVMEPLTIAGALLGAFLNKLLPELLLTILLVLLLSSTAYDTLKRAIKMYKKETIALKKQGITKSGMKESELTQMTTEQQMNGMEEATVKLLDDVEIQDNDESKLETATVTGIDSNDKIDTKDTATTNSNSTEATASTTPTTATTKPMEDEETKLQTELNDILEKERVTPMINIQILMTLFVVVLTINMLKGGGAFRSPLGIICGSTGFWIANMMMILWIVLISVFVRQYLLTKYYIKKRTNYQYVEGDIQWDERASIIYPFICMFAGFFAGMFGVGGGIVKGPLMLAMGVHPAVSSASSACMILFTSFTATTSYIVLAYWYPTTRSYVSLLALLQRLVDNYV